MPGCGGAGSAAGPAGAFARRRLTTLDVESFAAHEATSAHARALAGTGGRSALRAAGLPPGVESRSRRTSSIVVAVPPLDAAARPAFPAAWLVPRAGCAPVAARMARFGAQSRKARFAKRQNAPPTRPCRGPRPEDPVTCRTFRATSFRPLPAASAFRRAAGRGRAFHALRCLPDPCRACRAGRLRRRVAPAVFDSSLLRMSGPRDPVAIKHPAPKGGMENRT